MALVIIRKPEHFSRDGLCFEVTVGNSTVSVLHNGPVWTAYADTPFALIHEAIHKSSFPTHDCHFALFLLDSSHLTLLIGNEHVHLSDL